MPASDQLSAVAAAYARLAEARDDADRIMATAVLILAIFDEFYAKFCEYSQSAKQAFERLDPRASVNVSTERLGLYTRYVAEHGPRIRAAFEALSVESVLWDSLDHIYAAMIVDRYEADIAFSFAHSVRRNINHGLWKPVAYSFPPPSKLRAMSMDSVHRRLAVTGQIDDELLQAALQVPGFSVPFRDLAGDARKIRERVEHLLRESRETVVPIALDVVEAGFFRDRSAFIVGRWVFPDSHVVPLVVALLNSREGIYADAVVHRVADIHDLFSSTLANLHVTTALYYQTCVFLFSLMPRRPLGEHYSTIGYNHVGKVAILNEITAQLRAGNKFQRSPGVPGTVALGFTFDSCAYHLKVIRNKPTQSYKWGAFPGVTAVTEKYREVHEINRAGSMLDNVMYFNMRMDREVFDPQLLEEISCEASDSVQVVDDGVYLRSLIVQLKITPLPVYLERAGESETRTVIARLGHCIRNNAATNIFNKDLDSRNYGVGRYGRVFLFDYDAVEKLTEVKIRTNLDREPGEDDVPSWFFEDGVIFLPEELEHGMQFKSDLARRCFRQENAELLTMRYWLDVQQKLQRGEVPALRMYPSSTRLVPDAAR
jgi:isocitrate dehydrogenase kinase/phosphatase